MTTPRAVDDAAAAGDEFLVQLQAGEPAPDEGAPTPDPSTPQVPATPATAPDQELARLRDDLAREKHRNDTLQGRLESQLRPANDQIRALTKKMEDMEKAQRGPASTRYLKPEEGADPSAVDFQARVAKGVAEDAIQEAAELDREAREGQEGRLARLEQAAARNAYDSLWARVDRISPGARDVNDADPGWSRFLDGSDPLSGLSYREIGSAAVRSGDISRLAVLIGEYRTAAGLPAPAAPGSPAPSPRVVSQVRPGPGSARPAPTVPAGPLRIYKRSQMDQFFTDYTRGRYRGREVEAERIEAEFTAAVAEGRLVPG